MMKWIASAAFGMEGMTGRDLKRLGMQNVQVMDIGGAMFEGSFEDAFRANLWLRTCDRILLVMAQFRATSFEELFQGVKAIEWEGLLPEAPGRKYYECDIDFDGSYRNAKRIIFSNDGLIFYTEDHYESFRQLYGEVSP